MAQRTAGEISRKIIVQFWSYSLENIPADKAGAVKKQIVFFNGILLSLLLQVSKRRGNQIERPVAVTGIFDLEENIVNLVIQTLTNGFLAVRTQRFYSRRNTVNITARSIRTLSMGKVINVAGIVHLLITVIKLLKSRIPAHGNSLVVGIQAA